MMKKKLMLFLGVCLVLTYASSVFAAASLKRLGEHPFSPPLTSEADLRSMVGKNSADIQTGFTKAGYPELSAPFMAQFPTTAIETVRVAPGERFEWMIFRNRNTGVIKVIKDVTWDGGTAFDGYRFSIDKDGQRYEFIVAGECGNIALRSVGMVPAKPVPVPPPVAAMPEPPQEPAPPGRKGGPVADIGFAHQTDPASYVFGRVGYEVPVYEKLYAMGLVGGFILLDGDDNDDAFTVDALLNYYITEKFFIGAGAGFWSGEDGEVDLIANMGYQIYEKEDLMKMLIFLEVRGYADDFGERDTTRVGAGLRFRF
ncbi:MAG: hypothetical protein ACYC9M_00865 [Desulfobulbaceae bacterium]